LTGRQCCLFAIENPAGIISHLAITIGNVVSVAQEPAGLNKFAPRVDCRHAMTGSKRSNLLRSGDKERRGSDEYCIDVLLMHSREGYVDLVFGTGGEDKQLQP
jgi:hypothetical protein